MTSYTAELEQDFKAQGLGESIRTDIATNLSWDGLYSVLALTRNAGNELHRSTAAQQPEMQTELGKILLEHAGREGITPFSPIGSYHCYGDAEATLELRVTEANIENPIAFAPVTIVEDDAPLAIITGGPEFCSYGLRTNLERGVIAGFFSQAPEEILQRMRVAKTAFHINANEMSASTLLRASGLLVPVSERAELDPADRSSDISLVSHEEVTAQVVKLLDVSQPLPPADKESLKNWEQAAAYQYELPY